MTLSSAQKPMTEKNETTSVPVHDPGELNIAIIAK